VRKFIFFGFLVLFCGLFFCCVTNRDGVDEDVAPEGTKHIFDDGRNFFWIDVVDITSTMNLVAEWRVAEENKDKRIIAFSPTRWQQNQNGWLFLYEKKETTKEGIE